ncbi:MAG: hypothetical protein HOC74_39105 [Gemmatimonadetes bacterium]|nr:hypothetical protein [Gemmatimonadota bacterium]
MFNFLTRKKKQERAFNPTQELDRLSELSPPSSLVILIKKGEEKKEGEDMGRAFFLRRDKKLYTEGSNLYITTPDNLKIARDQNLSSQMVSLQFFHRRVPYRLECRIVGRFRLLPEVVETLDFNAKAAFKLIPTSPLRKQDKRQFYRYTLKNYGDSRIPLTTHITFDSFLKITDKEFPADGQPPMLINDMKIFPDHAETGKPQFATRDAINQFRDIMLKKPPHDRFVNVSKVKKDDSGGMVRRKDEELLLGESPILGLEMESLRDVLYLKKSAKAGFQKGKDNPYNLHPGERILTHFVHDRKYYTMVCELMEGRTQQEVVRPLEFPTEESGLHIEMIDYSVGGILVESSPDLLKLILGEKCPPDIEKEADFSGNFWEKIFEELRKPMIHLTFYPRLYFPDAVRKYRPELPFKVTVVAQVVRTNVQQSGERRTLQHGLQFAYEPQGIPLAKDEIVDWRYTRNVRDNEHFQNIHSKLSGLYGYLENQSLTSGATGARQRRPPPSSE